MAARQRFMHATQLFSSGDYGGALKEFEEAYAYKQASAVLYNIGVTLEKLGREDEALDVYQRYLATTPPQTRVTEVQQRIDALKRKLYSAPP